MCTCSKVRESLSGFSLTAVSCIAQQWTRITFPNPTPACFLLYVEVIDILVIHLVPTPLISVLAYSWEHLEAMA